MLQLYGVKHDEVSKRPVFSEAILGSGCFHPEAGVLRPQPDQQTLGQPGRDGGRGRSLPLGLRLPQRSRRVRQEERCDPHEGGGETNGRGTACSRFEVTKKVEALREVSVSGWVCVSAAFPAHCELRRAVGGDRLLGREPWAAAAAGDHDAGIRGGSQ